MIEILQENEKPSWVTYPSSYLELIQNEADEFLP